MISRTVYQGHNDYLTLHDIDSTEEFFKIEELRDLKRKIQNLTDIMPFDSLEQKCLAEKFFRIGYIAAHFNFSET